MKYNCDICGKECEFGFVPEKDDVYFVVCFECSGVMDAGIYTENED